MRIQAAPLAAVTRTFRPARSPPSRSVRNAVSPAIGTVAATSKPTWSGRVVMRSVRTATSSAQPASSTRPTIRLPDHMAGTVGRGPLDDAGDVLAGKSLRIKSGGGGAEGGRLHLIVVEGG